MGVESELELEAELQEFINRLIVPLLVEQMMAETGHLYGAEDSRYDTDKPLTRAA